jgi:hypothetical protein
MLAVCLAAAGLRAVDHVVVQQRRGVDELDRGGELVVARALVADQLGPGEREHRPHALAAAGDQVPGERGISGISLCMRSRMIALTAFIAVAVSERMGASEGSLTGRGTTSALMRAPWRVPARLASAESC